MKYNKPIFNVVLFNASALAASGTTGGNQPEVCSCDWEEELCPGECLTDDECRDDGCSCEGEEEWD
ncbi:MAG: hypothetical protein Q4C49_05725 [Bacillota bacterium]|nr:hypothetical protein [Bacillota bacterium]